MTFEDQLKLLIFYHLEEHVSARHMLQVLENDDFARENIAPEDGIKKSSFSEAINTRGLEQLQIVFEKLSRKATGILPNRYPELGDRGYQEHALFDSLQAQDKHFIIRIRANTTKTVVKANEVELDSIVFSDAEVLLGTEENKNQSQKPVRLVGYHVDGVDYWIASDRRDLTAEQIAEAYKLRWNIENFFAWWKRHLRVYHLIARSKYGLMVQILAGLITYLLLAIHCHNNNGEPVSIKRVRELRIKIQNELRWAETSPNNQFSKEQRKHGLYAKT